MQHVTIELLKRLFAAKGPADRIFSAAGQNKIMNQNDVLRLIDEIYEAAVDTQRWPSVLTRVADAFGASEASLSAIYADSVPWLVAPRSDPEYLASYGAYYHPLNLFWRSMSRLQPGTVVTDQMVLPQETLQSSEFYNDWSKPQGYLTVMGATLLVDDGMRVEFVMPGKIDFGPEHVKLYEFIAPHLTRAVRINQRLMKAEIDSQASLEALNRIDQGILIVDAAGRILRANAAAEAAFAPGGGLRLHKGSLRVDSPSETTELHKAIAGCGNKENDSPGGYVVITRGSGKPRLSLLVAPLPSEWNWIGNAPAAMIFISDPTAISSPDVAQIQQQFGLTNAEAALVAEAIMGDGMPAVADRLGIHVATARTHLQRVLVKTGTSRQAELVRLVLGSRHLARRDGD